MRSSGAIMVRIGSLAQRFDALALRERGLLFGASVILICLAWQSWWMGPLTARGLRAQQRITTVNQHLSALDQVGANYSDDPLIVAAKRNLSLKKRQASIDSELRGAAQGYVTPERMTELLREILANQRGLRLISLANLPVESLSQPTAAGTAAVITAKDSGKATGNDTGPFLHPVDMTVEGDYASIVSYLRALEGLSWRIHWQQLELVTGDYPNNRVRILIGALSLSPDWIKV